METSVNIDSKYDKQILYLPPPNMVVVAMRGLAAINGLIKVAVCRSGDAAAIVGIAIGTPLTEVITAADIAGRTGINKNSHELLTTTFFVS